MAPGKLSRTADPAQFRQLLGHFATGVTVVTALDAGGQPAGMTVSALSAASLDPPLLLVCVDHAADFHAILGDAQRFAVNVLAADQELVSRQFASTDANRFAGVAYHAGPGGLPLLEDVVAHVWCERREMMVAGDHTVFLGRVTGGAVFDRRPLVHYRGGYTSLGGPA